MFMVALSFLFSVEWFKIRSRIPNCHSLPPSGDCQYIEHKDASGMTNSYLVKATVRKTKKCIGQAATL